MVTQSASATRFTPGDRPRIAVAADGTLAAIQERTRIVIVEVASCAQLSELDLAGDALDSEAAWVGTPPRLIVLARYTSHSIVHLVDPFGPRTIAEMRLESAMGLCASVGNHALALGPGGAAVLTASERGLTPYQLPARGVPAAAGAAGAHFIVAPPRSSGTPATIEEWDPVSRLPKRRLKLPRPAHIKALGGSDRVVWLTTHQDPARIEVLPLVNRGQPKMHELAEPIAHVASHPRSDLIACIGATSGRIWVIDLDGRAGLRMIGPEGIDRAESAGLVLGRVAGLLAAQGNRPLALVGLEREEPRNEGEPAPAEQPRAARYVGPLGSIATIVDADAFGVFRERIQQPRAQTSDPFEGLWPDAPARWRDEIAAWTHDMMAQLDARTSPRCAPVEAMIERYDLAPSVADALALLYGAYLLGAQGAAPIDVARIASWSEALGRGELADKQLASYRESRIHLAAHVRRALDELPPTTGEIVGSPGTVSLLGPCVIVAAGPLAIVAEACFSSVGGAILAAHDTADPNELVAEARAYGCAPMLRVTPELLERSPAEQPIILVVDDDHTADQLGLPRLR